MPSQSLADEVASTLRYFDGHSDTLGLFAQPGFLGRAAQALVAPFRTAGITKVAGIEARGFVLATAAALELGVGFLGVRKIGGVLAGEKEEQRTFPDWRGIEDVLRLQRHVVAPDDRVLVVDDWAETGAKAVAARALIELCGGRYGGLSLLVNQLPEDVRATLEPVAFIVRAEDVAGE
jgi:adenine/guanine phosphoribosyltransferase-like PRPP-binding protein